MSETPNSFRHLGIEGVKRYLDEGTPGIVQVEGRPLGYLVIDPAGRRLAVQVPADGPVPDCARYENVTASRVRRNGQDWNESTVSAGDRLEDLYPLLCQVLDRVQLEHEKFSAAVLDVLGVYRSVLSTRAAMSEASQIGLYGELLVLEHIVAEYGPDIAMSSWLGPSDEEHDFAFPEFDLEVKTTSSERRRHWISSATQLARTAPKDLFLVSIQLTGAGAHGRSLPDIVAEVIGQVEHQSGELLSRLEDRGYRDLDADLYSRRWTLRTVPLAFNVDDSFPAVNFNDLADHVPDIARIVDFRYMVDVTGLPESTPEVLRGFIKATGESK